MDVEYSRLLRVYCHSLLELPNLLIHYSGELDGINTDVKFFKQALGIGMSRAY